MADFSVSVTIWNRTPYSFSLVGTCVDKVSEWSHVPAIIPPSASPPTEPCAHILPTEWGEGSFGGAEYNIQFDNGAVTYVTFYASDPSGSDNMVAVGIHQKISEDQSPPNVLSPDLPYISVPDITAPIEMDFILTTRTPIVSNWQPRVLSRGHPFDIYLTFYNPHLYKNWMSETRDIDTKTLKDLCLPCSHDSGTYQFTNKLAPELYGMQGYLPLVYVPQATPINADVIPEWMREALKLGSAHGSIGRAVQYVIDEMVVGLVNDWGRTVYRTVLQQLRDGIRVLDLRVCLTAEGEFRIFHTFTGPLMSDPTPLRSEPDSGAGILDQIKFFADHSTAEFIIVQASHIMSGHQKGLTEGEHQRLIGMITQALGDYLLDYDETVDIKKEPLGSLLTNWGRREKKTTILFLYTPSEATEKTGPLGSNLWPGNTTKLWIEPHGVTKEDLVNNMDNPGLFMLNFVLDTDSFIRADITQRLMGKASGSLLALEDSNNLRLRPFITALTEEQKNRINGITMDFEEFYEVIPMAVALSRRENIV